MPAGLLSSLGCRSFGLKSSDVGKHIKSLRRTALIADQNSKIMNRRKNFVVLFLELVMPTERTLHHQSQQL